MNITKTTESTRQITTDITGLQEMLRTGRSTAEKIAQESGAVLRVGRRKMYFVPKIESYLESLTEV